MRSLNHLYFCSSFGPFTFHFAFIGPIVMSLERSYNLWSLNKRYAKDAKLVGVVTFLLKVGSVSSSVTLTPWSTSYKHNAMSVYRCL